MSTYKQAEVGEIFVVHSVEKNVYYGFTEPSSLTDFGENDEKWYIPFDDTDIEMNDIKNVPESAWELLK